MSNPFKNANTVIAPSISTTPSGDPIPGALKQAIGDISSDAYKDQSGHLVILVSPNTHEKQVHFIPQLPNDPVKPLVIGRHQHADIVLQSDPKLSLRHVLLLLKIDGSGQPTIRALDLRTPTGMKDQSGIEHYSIAANGPVVLRVANSALFIVPTMAPSETLPLENLDNLDSWPIPIPWIPDDAPERTLSRNSEVTRNPSSMSLIRGRTGIGRPLISPPMRNRVGMIRFEHRDICYDHAVDKPALRVGVLFGRYGRCDLSTNCAEIPRIVSRVHALFITIEDRLHVVDTGSSNGLKYEDFPIQMMALPEHLPSTLEIASDIKLTWWPGKVV